MNDVSVFDPNQALELARDTLRIEADAVAAAASRLDAGFSEAVRLMLAAKGRVVVMGMGKSGHVGRKVAATLASTGTPALFVHPAEASHGDLGMITAADVVLAISNSGESDELTVLLPVLKRMHVALVAMTSRRDSSLGRHAAVWLDTSVAREACPLNLAPTASTTVQLAVGDALAVALLDARGFKPEDFARSHPGGSLGRKLLTHVRDVMRSGDAVPRVPQSATLMTLMREMSAKGLGRLGCGGRCRCHPGHLYRWRLAPSDRNRHRFAHGHGLRRDASQPTHGDPGCAGRRCRRPHGSPPHFQRAGGGRCRAAVRCRQHARPDACQGDLNDLTVKYLPHRCDPLGG
jgi:arabinose-5-phosphate isomerase